MKRPISGLCETILCVVLEMLCVVGRKFLLRMDRGISVQVSSVCDIGHVRENGCLARARGKLLPLAWRWVLGRGYILLGAWYCQRLPLICSLDSQIH